MMNKLHWHEIPCERPGRHVWDGMVGNTQKYWIEQEYICGPFLLRNVDQPSADGPWKFDALIPAKQAAQDDFEGREVGPSSPDPEKCEPDGVQIPRGGGLPDDPKARKNIPVATGFIDYFPDAMVEVAHLSWIGNEQHNPGTHLHWDRSKSGDESDCLMRHFVQRGTLDKDGVRHTTKVAWRAMALLQKELEEEKDGSE